MDTKISRRRFIQVSALAAGATMLPMPFRWLGASQAQAAFANSQPLSKWGVGQSLRGLNVATGHPLKGLIAEDPTGNGIPVMAGTPDPVFANTRLYEVAANEFADTLHPALPQNSTTLWGYTEVGPTAPAQKHLGGLIIATRGEATRMRMTNNLPSQHIIPVDPTLPGADIHNKIAIHLHGGEIPWISDGGPFDWWTPFAGQPNQAGLSFANGQGSLFDNITAKPMVNNQADYYYPNDQSTRLMWYHDHAHGITRINAYAGLATGYLCVDLAQESIVSAGTLTGSAAGDNVPFIGSAVPVVFQDKVFVNNPATQTTDTFWNSAVPIKSRGTGSLWYDHIYDPRVFRLKRGRGVTPPPTPTSCVPEFFGDTMLANGTVYPVATVEAKPTRFLFLNACNSRFLNMNLYQVNPGMEILTDPVTGLPANQIPSTGAAAQPLAPPVPPLIGPSMWQIGSEAGYLAAPAVAPNGLPFNPATFTGNLILGCAERADVVIDFSAYPAGSEFIIYNDAPGPFPAGPPTTDYWWGNPLNPIQGPPGSGPDTRQILRIKVVAATGTAAKPPSATMLNGVGPENLLVQYPATIPAVMPPLAPPANAVTKNFTLNEDFDQYGRLRQLVGTTTPVIVGGKAGFGREYLLAPAPEDQHIAGDVEVWNVYNLTADTHPMHIHLSSAQILKRQPFKVINGVFTPTGAARGPESNELGWKETFKMNPGEVTTICMRWVMPAVPFTVPTSPRATQALNLVNGQWGMGLPAGSIYNEYVWHCHILEHEEHDMMRPLIVTGQNPLSVLTVTPAATTVTASTASQPTTVTFTVSGGLLPITVNSSDSTNYPLVAVANTNSKFSVTVLAGATAATVTFSFLAFVAQGGQQTVTATLIIN